MKRAWVVASRLGEVRDAALGWSDARAIDASTLESIERAYPESSIELHAAWRVVVFVVACIAGGALFIGIFHGVRSESDLLWPTFLYGLLLVAGTEVLRGSRLAGTGADAAASLLAIVFLAGAAGIRLDQWKVESESIFTIVLGTVAVATALAAWRWGYWFWAGASVAMALLCIARFPLARPAWIVLSILLLTLTFRRLDLASASPAHRRCLAAVFAAAAAALYAAVNLYALDQYWIEAVRVLFRPHPPAPHVPGALRLGSSLATAAFPILFLIRGIRSRRRLLLGIAIASAALSVMTWRHYVPIGPQWAYLTECGVILIVAALWAHTRLRPARGGAWRGLTSAPLYGSRRDAHLTPLGALGAHLVVPTTPANPERSGFTGGGGEYGGGGASGQF